MPDKETEKQPEKIEGKKPETVFVHSLLPTQPDGGSKVALFESHPDHPGGEAFVAGEKPVEVAKTPEVLRALSESRIAEVGKPEAAKAEKK